MDKDASLQIRLKPTSASQKVRMDCLMAELIEHTEWIEGNYYMWQEKVVLEIYPLEGCVHLASIESSVERGIGSASQALDWLLHLATKHGVAISSTIQEIREGVMNHAQLRAWYVRHGFEMLENEMLLYRPSSAKK